MCENNFHEFILHFYIIHLFAKQNFIQSQTQPLVPYKTIGTNTHDSYVTYDTSSKIHEL